MEQFTIIIIIILHYTKDQSEHYAVKNFLSLL